MIDRLFRDDLGWRAWVHVAGVLVIVAAMNLAVVVALRGVR